MLTRHPLCFEVYRESDCLYRRQGRLAGIISLSHPTSETFDVHVMGVLRQYHHRPIQRSGLRTPVKRTTSSKPQEKLAFVSTVQVISFLPLSVEGLLKVG